MARTFIISTCLRYVDNTDFVKFLEEYNRYKIEIIGVHSFFDGLSNDLSNFVVAQNFKIFTCLRCVDNIDFVKFLEDYKRCKVEIFKAY